MIRDQATEYLKTGGVHCPFCKSHNIEGGSFEYDSTVIWQKIKCHDCGKNWIDVHDLTSVQSLDEKGQVVEEFYQAVAVRLQAADDLSNAVDAHMKARHVMTGPLDPKVIETQVLLLNAQQAYEHAKKD